MEIFLEDYGWTPVEMTPGDDGRIYTSYPGLDEAVFRLSRMPGEHQADRKESDSPGIFWEKAGQKTGEGYGVWLDYEKHREFYLILGTCLFCVVIFVPVLLDYRRLKRRQKLERMDCRQAFSAMTNMLHCAGCVQELEGWEKEFPQRVSKVFPEVAEEELHRVQEIVEEAAYGAKWPEAEKEQYVRWICLRLEELILKRRK